ncbi:MAG: hypothetical protein ACR2K6_07010 [Solirubrobacterales bacterium]
MDLLSLVADLVSAPVLIIGSIPGKDSDLDLLVREQQAAELERGLSRAGFERRGAEWVKLIDCSPEVIDLTLASAWGLAEEALGALYDEATPLELSGRVLQPAPHHQLLILARRAMREERDPKQKRLNRARAELARGERREILAEARRRAPAWGAERALAAFVAAVERGVPIPALVRVRAIAEELSGRRGWPSAWVGGLRTVLTRPRWGSIVALEGEPSGVVEQHAAQLLRTATKLGIDMARWPEDGSRQGLLGSAGTRAVGRRLRLYRLLLAGKVVLVTAEPGRSPRLPAPRLVHRVDSAVGADDLCVIAVRAWRALKS